MQMSQLTAAEENPFASWQETRQPPLNSAAERQGQALNALAQDLGNLGSALCSASGVPLRPGARSFGSSPVKQRQ